MRKLGWVLVGFMIIAAIGNIIGGTDTPATASVQRTEVVPQTQADIPISPSFETPMFVSASSLNLREAPTTGARVLTTLPRNTQVMAGERRGGWVLVSSKGRVGWVSGDYLAGSAVAPPISVPSQSQPGRQMVQQQYAASCPPRRYCSQIGSCQEARFYLENCSWGSLLDGDNDNVPCEALCR